MAFCCHEANSDFYSGKDEKIENTDSDESLSCLVAADHLNDSNTDPVAHGACDWP